MTIQRPIAEVFAYLASLENTYRQTRTIPRRSEEAFRVTAFDAVHELAIEEWIGPFRARANYRLEPAGGATRLVNRVAIELA